MMDDPVSLTVVDGVGTILVDHPPVNVLSLAVRRGLQARLHEAIADPAVQAIVLACAGRTFFVGADIKEFDAPIAEPSVPALVAAFEASSKPIVAALHGSALGGGFELALGCHYRVAATTARLAFPEVDLGILPAAGGTQRLPRLIGSRRALDILTSGRSVGAEEARTLGIVDGIVSFERLRDEAATFARSIAGRPPPRLRDRTDWIMRDRADAALFDRFVRDHDDIFGEAIAPHAIVQAVRATVFLPFDQAAAETWSRFEALVTGPDAAARRAVFFAARSREKA